MDEVQVDCAACGINICLTRAMYDRRVKDGKDFYCPNGHSNVYRPSADQKRIRELEERLESLDRFRQRLVDESNELWAQREELIGDLKVCPLGCGYRSRRQVPRDPVAMGRGLERVRTDMVDHLRVAHGARNAATKLLEAGA